MIAMAKLGFVYNTQIQNSPFIILTATWHLKGILGIPNTSAFMTLPNAPSPSTSSRLINSLSISQFSPTDMSTSETLVADFKEELVKRC